MVNGYVILGGGFASVEAKVAAVGRKLEPWMWLITLTGFALALWDRNKMGKMMENLR